MNRIAFTPAPCPAGRYRAGRSPWRRFAAALSALALALACMTAAAVPSRADPKGSGGIGAGVTATPVRDHRPDGSRHARPAVPTQPPGHHRGRPPVYAPPAFHPPAYRPPAYRPPVHMPPVFAPPPRYRDGGRFSDNRVLPRVCAIRISDRHPVYYGERCLRGEGLRGHLPQVCARDLRGPHGPRRVYDGGCLRDAGFVIPRPRH